MSDFQVAADLTQPFGDGGQLAQPWFNVLGNHEYGYNVSAQLVLQQRVHNWNLPARYYTQRIALSSSAHATFIFLDTSPCISDYRSENAAGHDPCGSQYPTCAIDGSGDDFEGACKFHPQIIAQDCGAQHAWLKTTLRAVAADDWLIIVGHHMADDIDVEDFTTTLEVHGFDLYLNGHVHTLQHYAVDGSSKYVTSGAGSMVKVGAEGWGEGEGVVEERAVTPTFAGRRHACKLAGASGGCPEVPNSKLLNHTYKEVWAQKAAGFTSHVWSADLTELTTTFHSTHIGAPPLHSFTVTRGVTPPAPAPTPAGGMCCHSSDASCAAGDICCASGCNEPAACSYTESGCTCVVVFCWLLLFFCLFASLLLFAQSHLFSHQSLCSGHYGQLHGCEWTGNTCVVGGALDA